MSTKTMTSTETKLTTTEKRRLKELEAVVANGLDTFMAVGKALMEIRESRLYRAEHPSFDDYLRQRWDISRVHAHRLIEAAEVVAVLPIGNTNLGKPSNEAQARELAPLKKKPEKMAEAWQEAVEQTGGKPTAKAVQQAVNKRTNAPKKDRLERLEYHVNLQARDGYPVQPEQPINDAATKVLHNVGGKFSRALASNIEQLRRFRVQYPDADWSQLVPYLKQAQADIGQMIERLGQPLTQEESDKVRSVQEAERSLNKRQRGKRS